MKNSSIATLLFIMSVSLYAYNTDEKSKYEFDSSTTDKNEAMAAKLSLFQDGLASDKDIDTYKKSTATSKQYAYDVMKIRDDGEEISNNQVDDNSSSSWFSWFESDDTEESDEVINVEQTNENQVLDDNSSSSWFSWFGSDDSAQQQEDENTEMKEEESSSWFSWFSDDDTTAEGDQ